MQTITMYLRATSVRATPVDEWNQPVSALPALTRGLRAELVLRLLDENGERIAPERLAYASWDFAVANDWDTTTVPQLRVTEGISVTDDGIGIPLTETNTEELVAALGKSEQATFGCELAGFTAGETTPEFLIQFDIVIRNRRADAGTGRPEPVGDGSYTAAQVRALFAARMEVQLSDDGILWREADPAEEDHGTPRFYRIRNAVVGGDWSDPLPLVAGPRGARSTVRVGTVSRGESGSEPAVSNSGDEHDAVLDFTIPAGPQGDAASIRVGSVGTAPAGTPAAVSNSGTASAAVLDFTIPTGPQGEKGHDSYTYVAYASKPDGTGFSLVPAAGLRYRAEIHTDSPVEGLSAAHFAGAVWQKYLGDDGASFGDVLVADSESSVPKVTRIVFENARVRKGDDGEAIVSFKEAGIANGELEGYAVVNGRTRLSAWINGGGSPGAAPGLEPVDPGELTQPAVLETHSTFIG